MSHRLSPMIYQTPGYEPDVRLKIFDDLELHVHSIILKLNSAFFRKFLDSPEKQHVKSTAPFTYEWATEIDDDGTWSLVSDGPMKVDQCFQQ